MTLVYIKQPAESRRYAINFTALLAPGDTIASITSITGAPSGLTISGNAIDSPRARFRVAGGADGVLYKVTAVVVTTAGDTLEADGEIEVANL